MPELQAQCKLWITCEDQAGVFGDGKVRLLQEIQRTGSLREAAAALKISYRKAWGDLKKAEAGMKMRLLEKTRGGRDGGHTVLTEAGETLVRAYQHYTDRVHRDMEQAFEELIEELKCKSEA